mmetsp:Transcript_13205/g.32229  ORF Transcript_13205/g.32229 Transcript_13205/m.32229 type:complete len:248 (+) Transcript_13205:238-981(+)
MGTTIGIVTNGGMCVVLVWFGLVWFGFCPFCFSFFCLSFALCGGVIERDLRSQSTTHFHNIFATRTTVALPSFCQCSIRPIDQSRGSRESKITTPHTKYSNIQDRMSNQRNAGDTQAIVTVVKAVLELLDNFDRAYGVVKPATPDEEAIEAEYKQAYQQILDTFAKLGVREVETVGTEFDYELHQAVMQIPDPNYEEGIVCQEFQKGFVMGEEKEPKAEDESENEDDEDDEGTPLTLIRPAMVAVAA